MKAYKNIKFNGIEILFDEKPSEKTREALKNNGFRWNGKTKVWYIKESNEAINFITSYFNIGISESGTPAPTKAKENNLISLWDRLNVDNIPKHKYTSELKNITAETRKHFKEVFPELKVSCKTGGSGWSRYNEIYFELLSAPYNKETNNEIIEAIEKYIKSWLWSYNYDNSDSMTDYFDRGFYESIHTNSYTETEPTEAQKEDINNFYMCLDLFKKAEEEAERIRFEEYKKEQEESAKRWKERQERETAQAEAINKHVKVIDLEENKKYLISSYMLCGIGKENSTTEIISETEYNKRQEQTALIKRELYFEDKTIYEYFCNMFLFDFDFCAGCGGTGTYDKRVTDENFNKLNTLQRESVKWILWDCIAVYFNNELKLIIDPEGFNYCRYVNIIESEYKKEAAPIEESQEEEQQENNSFYIPASIATQAENLEINKDFTLINIDPWTLTAQMKHIKLINYIIKDYAQYKNSLFIEWKEPGKRITHSQYYHDGNELLIYSGHLESVPSELLYKQISDKMQLLRYSGSESYNFMIDCYKHYKSIGHEPIINTLQF